MIGESTMKAARQTALLFAIVVLIGAVACGGKKPPVARPLPPPPPGGPSTAPPRPPAPPEPVSEPTIVPPEPVRDDAISSASLDDLNKSSPLKPVFYELDSSELSAAAQQTLDENAALLKRYPSWTVTVEGHCDSRASSEYNLALGNRRAVAVKDYLVSLGVQANRLTVVSKGKEQPVCTEDNEECWQRNRRGHFLITAK